MYMYMCWNPDADREHFLAHNLGALGHLCDEVPITHPHAQYTNTVRVCIYIYIYICLSSNCPWNTGVQKKRIRHAKTNVSLE